MILLRNDDITTTKQSATKPAFVSKGLIQYLSDISHPCMAYSNQVHVLSYPGSDEKLYKYCVYNVIKLWKTWYVISHLFIILDNNLLYLQHSSSMHSDMIYKLKAWSSHMVYILMDYTLRLIQHGRHFSEDIFNGFSWTKMYEIRLRFHWNLFAVST